MAHLCLKDSELIRGFEFGEDPRFLELLNDESRQPLALYPGPQATVVNEANRDTLRESWAHRPPTVFLIDGTWPQAKKMFRVTPQLQVMPWIAFETDRRSQYKFRLQPDPLCLSTIEAVHELIDALDRFDVCHPTPDGAHQNLVDVFKSMNDTQLRYINDPALSGYRRGPYRPMNELVPAKRWQGRPILFRSDDSRDRPTP